MGNASSLKHHLETAEKTGVIKLSKSNLREIPKDLLNISHLLRTLDLSYNRLQQTGDLSPFKNLRILNLSQNKLKNLSASIRQLERLETLLLQGNLLENLPSELGYLDSLKLLNLSNNKLTNFPKPICHLRNLEAVDLSENLISLVPEDISSCHAAEINLNNNQLRKLPETIADCSELKILRLDNNQLPLTAITRHILSESKICLLCVENNQFTSKQLHELDGYEDYSARYTFTKRKMI